MKISIRWKWIITYLSIWGVVLLFIIFWLGSRLENYFESRFESRWTRELALAITLIESQDLAMMDRTEADKLTNEMGLVLDMRVTLIDVAGVVLGDSEVAESELASLENHNDRPEVVQAREHGFGKSRRHSTTLGMDLVYLASILGTTDQPQGVLRIAVAVAEIEDSLAQIQQLIWLAGGLGFALFLVVGFFVSKSMTKRMEQMTEAAKNIARGNFTHVIRPKQKDELADLGEALDQMARDLQKYVRQITHERDQLQVILDSMVEGVMVTNARGRIILINRSFQDIFGLTGSIVNQSVETVIEHPQLLQAIEKSLSMKKGFMESIEIKKPQSKSLDAHIALLGSKQQPAGTVVVFHDITRLLHLESVRRDFVANISHEIRTPLTAIKGYTETLLEQSAAGDDKPESFLQVISRNTDRISKIVEQLLRLSKLESMDFDLEFQNVDLNEVIPQVVQRFESLNGKQTFDLDFDLQDNLPVIHGNVAELETALESLIENAIKYGREDNQILVTAREKDDSVEIAVADRGIGIPEDDQPRIFERFYRVARARSRVMGGTGLGLSIVKHIIRRHHGEITLESEVGKGSTFRISLPKHAVPELAKSEEDH